MQSLSLGYKAELLVCAEKGNEDRIPHQPNCWVRLVKNKDASQLETTELSRDER